jgi:2-(1,2-epoxy-1,2-dihydrophenyl)acetyl-CoA isomerase
LATYDTIRYEAADGLARLTLARPEHRNGITNQMVRELCEALLAAAADPTLRVLVLTGDGASFSPGADLGSFTSGEAQEHLLPWHFRCATLLHDAPFVTVAAINGACAGAGFGWALACDLRLMKASAKCNVAFMDVGVAGDMGIPWTLTRIVGSARAREFILMPRKLTAEECLALGIVARVSPDDAFDADVEAVVRRLMAASPTALWGVKANLVTAERTTFADYVELESERHLRGAASEDTREGFRAFMEKRPPRFVGR